LVVGLGRGDDSKLLRYRWEKGTDHYYRVSIRVELDAGAQEFVSTPLYHVADHAGGELKLLFFGTLSSTRPELFRTLPVTHDLAPFMRGPAGAPLASDFKLTVSDRGRIIALQGKHELPYWLGDLAQLPFVLLPKEFEKTWTSTREVTLALPSGDYRLPRGVLLGKSLQAEEETTYTVTGVEGPVVKINVDARLASLERVKQMPTLQLNAQAVAKFDRTVGAIVSYEAKAELSVRQNNTITEVPLAISVSRVSDQEVARLRKEADELLAKAKAKIAADQAERNRPIDAGEMGEIVKTLKSNDREKLQAVLQRLSTKTPARPEARVSKAIEPHLASNDPVIAMAAFGAIKNWGTEDSVPALLEALDDSNSFGRLQAIQTLAKFPSKRVADELGLLLTDPLSHSMAAASLKQMGRFAEDPTLAALKKTGGTDAGSLFSIISVLQEVGGAKSLAALKPLAGNAGGSAFLVQNALREIERRVEREKLRKR
jgi:hypothetical protein